MTEINELTVAAIVFGAALVVLAAMCAVSRYRRRKDAERTAMRCLAMSDDPRVTASRNVH